MKSDKFIRVDADNLDELVDAGVARATAARELSAEEIGEVSGAALLIRKEWFGIWEWNRTVASQSVLVDRAGAPGGLADLGNFNPSQRP